MAEAKRAKNKRVEPKLKEWLANNLESDRWAEFSWNEIAEQAKVSGRSASRKVLPLVAEMTDRTLEEVEEIRRRQWESLQATPFDVFCIQQLRQRDPEKWEFKRIASLVGFGYTTVRKHTLAPPIEMPADTGGREISDQLRQMLADELRIGIRPDGATHTLDQSLSEDIDEPHETHQASLEAEASELDTASPHESAPLSNGEPSEQDRAVVKSSGASGATTEENSPAQPLDNLVLDEPKEPDYYSIPMGVTRDTPTLQKNVNGRRIYVPAPPDYKCMSPDGKKGVGYFSLSNSSYVGDCVWVEFDLTVPANLQLQPHRECEEVLPGLTLPPDWKPGVSGQRGYAYYRSVNRARSALDLMERDPCDA